MRWIVSVSGEKVFERADSSCGSFIVATEPVVARRRCFLESWWSEARNGVVVWGIVWVVAIFGLLVVGSLCAVLHEVGREKYGKRGGVCGGTSTSTSP